MLVKYSVLLLQDLRGLLLQQGGSKALIPMALDGTDKGNTVRFVLIKYAGLLLQDLRGLVAQQGGSKALIPMALDGTNKGTHGACHAD
jgi:hypothetical protein